MGTFFKHENHQHPPSLSERGKLRRGKKSDLFSILAQETQNAQKEPPPFLNVRILDGAAVVHMLSPTKVTTFNDYANGVFIPHILKLLKSCRRVDMVWDSYSASSIKGSTRKKKGKGVRRKVSGPTKVPGSWPAFLWDPTNKELFQFLSDKVSSNDWPDGKVFITSGIDAISRGSAHSMPRCDHEEADTKIVIHLKDALDKGCSTCLVCTVDTHIVILIGKYRVPFPDQPTSDASNLGSLWKWKELYVSGWQCYLPNSGLQYDFSFLWQREKISMAGLECLQ